MSAPQHRRKPPTWLSVLSFVLVAVSFPVDGLPGIALAFTGAACSVRYLVLRRRYLDAGGAR